jgi:hypothetical protein
MKIFNIIVILIAVYIGYLCSQFSPIIYKVNIEYQKQEDKIDRLISVLEDWKEKDTSKK